MKVHSSSPRTGASKLKALGVAVALAGSAGAALAVPSAASVSITAFDVVTSTGTALTWSDPYQSFQTSALEAGGLLGTKLDGFDTPDYLFGIASADTASAHAALSTSLPQTFFASASTTSTQISTVSQPNQAQAGGLQSGAFMLTGGGSVTFSIGYTLTANSTGGASSFDYGQALLSFSASNADGSSGGQTDLDLSSFSQALNTRSGTLTLTVDLVGDETGFYNLQGTAIAFSTSALPVPEPGQWLLMTAGLLGVAAGARRGSKHAA